MRNDKISHPLASGYVSRFLRNREWHYVGPGDHQTVSCFSIWAREMPARPPDSIPVHTNGLVGEEIFLLQDRSLWQFARFIIPSGPLGDWVVPNILLETPQTVVFIRGLQSFVVSGFVFYLFSFLCPSCFCFNSIRGKVKEFVASVNLAHLSGGYGWKSGRREQQYLAHLQAWLHP